MAKFSFVHASDLHLDSPFQGLSRQDPSIADILRSATFSAYQNLVRLCIQEKVQFLLVAGDVYDGADRSLRAQLQFRDGLHNLAQHGIKSFVVHGNHDPLDGWSATIEWPAGVHVFGGTDVDSIPWAADGVPLACISGISYPRQKEQKNLARQFSAQRPDLFQIALLHCNCGGDTDHEVYAPCSMNDLITSGFDYWALGHVHKHRVLNTNPYVVYSGNTQGRSIREQGECGCWLVTVDDRQVRMDYKPLDVVRWTQAEVGIDSLDSIDALDRAIANKLDDLRNQNDGRPLICRLTLTGRGSLYHQLNHATAVEDLLTRVRESGLAANPFFWIQSLDCCCRPELDLERRSQSPDLLGQVLTLAHEMKARGDLPVELKPVMDDLFDDGRARRALETLTPPELEQILEEAKLLCVDLLEADE